MIPEELKNSDFRLVKINPQNRKAPLEKNWTTTANYQVDDPNIQQWIEDGNNYGVATGFGNLIVIDSDTQELQELVEEHLPETLQIKTGGGGYHNYYICKNQHKIIFEKDGKHLGELQSIGQQVIGPGSTHPNGNKYVISKNLPITEITEEDIEKLPEEIFKKAIQQKEEPKNNTTDNNLNVLDVIPLNNLTKKANGEYQGPHPIHSKKGGR